MTEFFLDRNKDKLAKEHPGKIFLFDEREEDEKNLSAHTHGFTTTRITMSQGCFCPQQPSAYYTRRNK